MADLTVLKELRGHEERIGARRPSGSAYSRNFGGDNWVDMRRRAVADDDREPAVLVVGGAQSGLAIAARLNQLGVHTLVVERWPRIGDSWRRRYHSLALHNSSHINHLPYMDFPPTWPTSTFPLALCPLFIWRLVHSPAGRALEAIRQNELLHST